MIDIKLIRENPEMVRQNMRNKFQDNKVELVDKVLALDSENRTIKTEQKETNPPSLSAVLWRRAKRMKPKP